MAYLNYFLQFKAFADKNLSNSPSLSLTNWVRNVQGVAVDNVATQYMEIPASGSITVFTAASKTFAYVEADAPLALTINGASTPLTITPVVIGSTTQPGSFLINASLTSLVLTNPSTTDAVGIFVAHAE
jgi:hypothetical protein